MGTSDCSFPSETRTIGIVRSFRLPPFRFQLSAFSSSAGDGEGKITDKNRTTKELPGCAGHTDSTDEDRKNSREKTQRAQKGIFFAKNLKLKT
jgi:hypothetical protein